MNIQYDRHTKLFTALLLQIQKKTVQGITGIQYSPYYFYSTACSMIVSAQSALLSRWYYLKYLINVNIFPLPLT